MTFVGKVLVVVQLVLAVCFMAFAGAVYTAETNWKKKATDADTAAQQARSDASAANQQLEQAKTELGGQVAELNQRVALREGELKQASDQLARTEQQLQEARTAADRATAVANVSEEQARFRQEETLRQRERNQRLQGQIDELLASVRNYEDTLFQKNLSIEQMEVRHQELIDQLATYRDILLTNNLSLNPEDYGDLLVKADPPPRVKGQVLNTEVSKTSGTEFVEVSLGSDDGFQKGHTLDVYRGDQYLGKIRLTTVYPDRAVGQVVTRPRNGTIKKGDNVTPRI